MGTYIGTYGGSSLPTRYLSWKSVDGGRGGIGTGKVGCCLLDRCLKVGTVGLGSCLRFAEMQADTCGR